MTPAQLDVLMRAHLRANAVEPARPKLSDPAELFTFAAMPRS